MNAVIIRGEQKMQKKIDILYLFKKIHQFKFLKKRFFSDKELQNFNYRPLLTFKTFKINEKDCFRTNNKNQHQINVNIPKNIHRSVETLDDPKKIFNLQNQIIS